MAFKVLSKKDWNSEGFVGLFSVGVGDWFGDVDWGSVNDLGIMND